MIANKATIHSLKFSEQLQAGVVVQPRISNINLSAGVVEEAEVYTMKSIPLALCLCFISKLAGAHSLHNLINCPDGDVYNKNCETACNRGYEKCRVTTSYGDEISLLDISKKNKCRDGLSKCMKACYATAAEKCAASSSWDDSDRSDGDTPYDEDDGNHEEAWILGVMFAAAAVTAMVLLLSKNCHKDEIEWENEHNNYATLQDIIEEDNEVLGGERRELVLGDMIIANNNSEMIPVQTSLQTAGDSIISSTVPLLKSADGENGYNEHIGLKLAMKNEGSLV